MRGPHRHVDHVALVHPNTISIYIYIALPCVMIAFYFYQLHFQQLNLLVINNFCRSIMLADKRKALLKAKLGNQQRNYSPFTWNWGMCLSIGIRMWDLIGVKADMVYSLVSLRHLIILSKTSSIFIVMFICPTLHTRKIDTVSLVFLPILVWNWITSILLCSPIY